MSSTNHPQPLKLEPPLPPPPSLSLLAAVQPLEHSPTPPPASPQAVPLESKQEENECFDLIAALLGVGVPHIVLLIMSYLDTPMLTVVERVSSLWREISQELPVWKHAVLKNVESRVLWRELFERRGWHMYLTEQVPEHLSWSINYLYRQLHQSASRDSHSLEANWRRGHYTLTRIQTGCYVHCLQYDSKKIVSGHHDNTIKIWDKNTLKLLNTLIGHVAPVGCLQFNHEVVVSGSYDRSIKVWDIQTGQMINELRRNGYVRALKFNSELLITGSDDRTVAVWDFNSPTAITLKRVLRGDPGRVMAVDVTDTYIIAGFGRPDSFIKIWDSCTGGLLHTLQHSEDGLESLQCRGNLLVSGCFGIIRVWNVDTGDCLREWEGHKSFICGIAVDDKRIVTGSKVVKIWCLSTVLDPSSSTDALCIATLQEHTSDVVTIQIDDFSIVSGAWDDSIVIRDFLDPVPACSIFEN